MGDLSDDELRERLGDEEFDRRLLYPTRTRLVGRRIEDVRFLSDEEDVRVVPDPDAEDGVRLVRRGDEGFDENDRKIKLCLDDGSAVHLGLSDFSIIA